MCTCSCTAACWPPPPRVPCVCWYARAVSCVRAMRVCARAFVGAEARAAHLLAHLHGMCVTGIPFFGVFEHRNDICNRCMN
jgi:hypothetical protein